MTSSLHPRSNDASADAPRPRILLVDDVPENLVALAALLREEDVEILEARSGPEALEILLDLEVALALVDVQMPEMDGFELAELMRGSSRTRHVPILFVTAGARSEERIFRGYEAGAVDYLLKPIEPVVLQNKVRTFLQLYRQREQLGARLEQLQRISAERQRLVEELQQTLRLNELYLAALSHDLRSPLSAILAGAEILRRRTPDEAVHRAAKRIQSSGESMARMIESLLDLAQARVGGGLRLRPESVHLPELVERVIGEHRLLAPNRLVEVAAEGNLRGMWDPGRLHRLVSNLVGNAIQHGTQHPPIRVELDGAEGERVHLRVRNGGAIATDLLGELFNPFRVSTSRHRGGLGLGLFSVQQIARAHGGDVAVRSSEAEGTCVEVTLRRVVEG